MRVFGRALRIIAATVLFCHFFGGIASAATHREENGRDRYTSFIAGSTSAIGAWNGAFRGYDYIRRLPNRGKKFFGDLSEMLMHDQLATGGYSLVNANVGTGGVQGLDGLYIKYDKHGRPNGIIIGESKWNKSQLGRTADGAHQMDSKWINKRVEQTANRFHALREKLEVGKVQFVNDANKVVKNSSWSELRVGGKKIQVWVDPKNGKLMVYSDQLITQQEIATAFDQHEAYLRGAAANGNYRASIFRTEPTAGGIKTTLETYKGAVDAGASPTTTTVYEYDIKTGQLKRTTTNAKGTTTKEYDPNNRGDKAYISRFKNNIKRSVARSMENDLTKEYERQGLTKQKAQSQAKEDVDAKLNKMTEEEIMTEYQKMISAPTWKQVGLEMAKTSAFAAGSAVVIDAIMQAVSKGSIDITQSLKMGAFAGASAAAAYSTHYAVSALMRKLTGSATSRLASSVSTIGAGAAGAGVFALGMWASGMTDGWGAARTFGEGLAWSGGTYLTGLAIKGAIVWGVGTFGTASSGAAIASLVGAAKTNAILAWLGGGAVSAGGGGVAAGGALLGSVVPIVGWGVFAITTIYTVYKIFDSLWHSDDNNELLRRRIDLLAR